MLFQRCQNGKCLGMIIYYLCLMLFWLQKWTVNAEPMVFLTVSPLVSRSNAKSKCLQLNWFDLTNHTPDDNASVRLYKHDPIDNSANFSKEIKIKESKSGYYRTTFTFNRETFARQKKLKKRCLGFWIAYVVNDIINIKSCLKSRPHWMNGSENILGKAKLSEIVIPGTHMSGSYDESFYPNDTLQKRYTVTQEEDVYSQLVFGIRYLDLRVAFRRIPNTEDQFWITHSVFYSKVSINTIVSDVKDFLNLTNEIVIMDFYEFVAGFSGRRAHERHRLLIQYLESELSDLMIPVSTTLNVTLNDLWAMKRRLLVIYSDAEGKQSKYLFPAIRRIWRETDNVENLLSQLKIKTSIKPQLTSTMLQLTPKPIWTVFDAYGGLRRMAHDVNERIQEYVGSWGNVTNIISTDFFLGNNIIEYSIKENEKRFPK